jgi:AcrR family transcriptional regulator
MAGADSGHGIWTRPEPGVRQSRFSREQIAAAALSIADAEGFDAVSMRRIASSLGAGTMSLYRYIQTKDELLDLLDDALLAEALVPGELPAGWRDALSLIARQIRRAHLSHPWAVSVLQHSDASRAGPAALRHAEQQAQALDGAPLSAAQKLDLVAIVSDYVTGHLLRAAESRADPAGLDDRFELGLRLLIDGFAAASAGDTSAPSALPGSTAHRGGARSS